MKILVLTNLYPNPIQPHQAPWNRAQVRALSHRHEVRVICPVLWTEEWSAARRRTGSIPASRQSLCDGIEVLHPRYYYPPKFLRSAYGHCFLWSVSRAFEQAVGRELPDVIYASWAYPDGWAAVQLGSSHGIPVVVRVLGSDILALEEYPGRLRKTVEALTRASKVIAVSRDLADQVEKLGLPRNNIEVVYNGLDIEAFCPGSREVARARVGIEHSRPTILFVGNLVPVKGLETLIEACALLHAQGLDFECHLVGEGPLRPKLTELVAKRGLTRKITFHGRQPQETLPAWYRSSDIVALPSQSEGIPNVLLEATACGIPFVASRVGGIAEIEAHRRSQLVPAGDSTAFAEAIAQVLSDPGTFDGRNPVPARSWEESALELEEILLAAAQTSRRAAAVTSAR